LIAWFTLLRRFVISVETLPRVSVGLVAPPVLVAGGVVGVFVVGVLTETGGLTGAATTGTACESTVRSSRWSSRRRLRGDRRLERRFRAFQTSRRPNALLKSWNMAIFGSFSQLRLVHLPVMARLSARGGFEGSASRLSDRSGAARMSRSRLIQ